VKRIRKKIAELLDANQPFVIYRKPNVKTIHFVFQIDSLNYEVSNFKENGFVFAPFSDKERSLFIPYSKAEQLTFKIEEVGQILQKGFITNSLTKEKADHLNLVEKGIDFIQKSTAKKIVLSRKEILKKSNFNIEKIVQNLLKSYPTAFVYCWFHPVSGIWMGATPERLLTIDDAKFSVMALASTQEFKGNLEVDWGEKEQQEHQFVVDYIASKFVDQQLEISKTYTVKAGSLLHLRADIKGDVEEGFTVTNLIKKLHPTPATCGLPKEIAQDFILENENYNREYYTGYLGEVKEKTANLFVNLRCMKMDKDKNEMALYIGGGITKDSTPEKEWLETVAKSKVMKKVL